MAEPERKTARSILAYERGARIAQRLTVISVLIGMTAIIFGGGVVWWAKRDLDRTIALKTEAESERQVAQAATDAAKKNFADLTAVNDRLVRLGTLVSGLRADDATGTSLALQEIDALLGMTEETELMTSIGLKLREMRIGIYVTTNALDKAIAEQRALNVALEASPGRVLDLAILQCRAKDPAGARETLRAGLSTDDAALLTDDDRLLSACGNAVAGLAAQLAPLAAADASMGEVPEPESPASVEEEKSLPVDPGRNPAAADGVTPAAPASKAAVLGLVNARVIAVASLSVPGVVLVVPVVLVVLVVLAGPEPPGRLPVPPVAATYPDLTELRVPLLINA